MTGPMVHEHLSSTPLAPSPEESRGAAAAMLRSCSASLGCDTPGGGGGLIIPSPPPTTLSVAGGGGGKIPVHRVYCVGRNYYDHGIEMGGNPDREPPFFFMKPADAVVDTSSSAAGGASLPYPQQCGNFHFECEMVIVLDTPGGRRSAFHCLSLPFTAFHHGSAASASATLAQRRPESSSSGKTLPFLGLPPPFRCFFLTFQCLSAAFPWPPTAFPRCPSLASHRLSTALP